MWAVWAKVRFLASVNEEVVAQVLTTILPSDAAATDWASEVLPHLLTHNAANQPLQQDHALSGCRSKRHLFPYLSNFHVSALLLQVLDQQSHNNNSITQVQFTEY